MMPRYIKQISAILLLCVMVFTKTHAQPSTYTTGTAPYNFTATNIGNNSAYTTRYILINTTTNLIAYTSTSPTFSDVAAGVYQLFAVNYTGTTPTLSVGTDFRNIGGSCIAVSSAQSTLYVKTGTTTTGTVTSVNCGTASPSTATAGVAYSGTESVSFTGSNNGTYSAQSVASTGVTGLTATLPAGVFACCTGSVTYAISGTPSGAGTASFTITLGGQSCAFTITVGAGSTTQDYTTTITVNSFGQFVVNATKTYTVNYTNALATAATNTETAQITGPFGWTCTGCGPVTIPVLGVGQTHTVSVSLTAINAGSSGSLSSNITAASGGDTRVSNNNAAVSTLTAN